MVGTIFFDCDDTLYKNAWATASKLNDKFADYCSTNLGISKDGMMDLYKTYGTTLCGLIRENHIAEAQVQDFLAKVHDVPLDDIKPDHSLRALLESLPQRRWVFTAATKEHAERCLQRLGIQDLFLGIIACSSSDMFAKAGYVSKHDPRCFEVAMQIAGVRPEQAASCMLLDDSVSNLKTAKGKGWQTVLVGLHGRDGSRITSPDADFMVHTIHDIRNAIPEMFDGESLFESMGAIVERTDAKAKVDSKADQTDGSERPKRRRVLKPLDSSPERKVLRRVATPLSPRAP
uniref:Pyrimidine 5-nucleotidase n=1 Tax=Pyrodinium bahamense TaxID=73915 RepID=A0A7R9ZY67_9DINO